MILMGPLNMIVGISVNPALSIGVKFKKYLSTNFSGPLTRNMEKLRYGELLLKLKVNENPALFIAPDVFFLVLLIW